MLIIMSANLSFACMAPFRWGAGDFARTYGLRFSGGAAAKDLSNVCRDAMRMEWQRPKDSLLPRSSPPSRPASTSQREEHNHASKAAASPAQGPPGGGDRWLEGDVLRPLVENLEAALGAMDGSGRGYLTPAELREALMVLDEVEDLGMTNSQIDSLLSLVPPPPVRGAKAGLIDWREYVAAVRRECFPASSSPPPPAPKGAGASSKSRQQDIVKYDHMQMAAKHVPKHPMESLAASHSMIQSTSVVTSSHNVMNAPNHPSNFSTSSFLTTPKQQHQQQQQQQQQPSPSSVESLSRSHGVELGQSGAACREALAEIQDMMSRLRLEEVGRGGGKLTSSNSVSVSFKKLSEWAEALKKGVASASERDRLASAIPRYEEALAHTVARCAERWSGGGEGSAGLREEVEERISSVSQVRGQNTHNCEFPWLHPQHLDLDSCLVGCSWPLHHMVSAPSPDMSLTSLPNRFSASHLGTLAGSYHRQPAEIHHHLGVPSLVGQRRLMPSRGLPRARGKRPTSSIWCQARAVVWSSVNTTPSSRLCWLPRPSSSSGRSLMQGGWASYATSQRDSTLAREQFGSA